MTYLTRWMIPGLCGCVLGVSLAACQPDAPPLNQPASASIHTPVPVVAQEEPKNNAEAGVATPQQLPVTPERLKQLKLPPGFQVNIFAQDTGNARMIAVLSDGTVLITRPEQDSVLALKDTNQDGEADTRKVVASDLNGVHGIAVHRQQVYLATTDALYVASLQNDQPMMTIGQPRRILGDLPTGGRHPKRTLGFDAQDRLYISIGSTCDACVEKNPESAAIIRMQPDGTQREIFARGLRNTIGFGWQPQTGQLLGLDIGRDWGGGNIPPEELNRLEQGRHYGWPWCYGNQQVDAKFVADEPKQQPGGNQTPTQFCAQTAAPVLEYQAHSSPIGMVFYTGKQFPAAYQGDAFVAMRGSWNRKPPTGYKVVRISFDNGQPVEMEDFMTGFLSEDGKAHFGRLAGVAIAADGSLLVSDDANGVIYRVSYQP